MYIYSFPTYVLSVLSENLAVLGAVGSSNSQWARIFYFLFFTEFT